MERRGQLRWYLQRYWARLALGFLFVLASNSFALTIPWVLRQAIDTMAGANPASLELWQYALATLLFGSCDAGLRFLTRITIQGVSREIEYEMRNHLFAHLQRLEQAYFQNMRTGDLVARLANDLSAVRSLLGPGLTNLFNTVIVFTASMILMFSISPRLATAAALLLPLLAAVYITFKRALETRFRAVQDQFATLSARAQENLAGIRVVKAYAQEEAEIADFRRVSQEYVSRNVAEVRVSGLLWPAMSLVSGLAAVALLYVGGGDVIAGRMTLGQFVQFGAYLGMLAWPMIALGWVVNLYQQGRAALQRISEVFDHEPTVVGGPGEDAGPLPQSRGEVEFRKVSFVYASTPVLRDIDLHLPSGATLGLAGPTGSGKSTLVNLIARVYDPTEGQVLVDGLDILAYTLAQLRQRVGYVPQETFLFSDTLRNNVAFGRQNGSEVGIEKAVALAQLEKDLEDLPAALDTMLGERGVTLSGGQKQRTAIARAIVHDPRVLILDDALSSVDSDTEHAILQGLRQVLADRTGIIVSHRLSAIQDCDQIIVLQEGRITERGTHQQLMEMGGWYARTYRLQRIAQELGLEGPEEERDTTSSGRRDGRAGSPSGLRPL